MQKPSQADKLRLGLYTIIGLAVLTLIEYVISIGLPSGNLLLLTIIAVIKAWLIIMYFMHLSNLWNANH